MFGRFLPRNWSEALSVNTFNITLEGQDHPTTSLSVGLDCNLQTFCKLKSFQSIPENIFCSLIDGQR